jgi:glycosyltransferase involved in cell wall biosynthesis
VRQRPLRVLFATESLAVWGAETSLLALLEYARSNGCEPTVAVARASPLTLSLDSAGIPYIYHDYAPHPALMRTGSLSGARVGDLIGEFLSVLRGAIRSVALLRQYDVVVPFSLWQSLELALGAKLSGTKAVLDIHETFNGRLGKQLVRAIGAICSGAISPSEALAQQYNLSKNLRIVPRPLPEQQVGSSIPPSQLERSRVVGIFGQIASHKQVLELVRAVEAATSDERLTLLVVGGTNVSTRSAYEDQVRVAVGRLGGTSRVEDRVSDITPLILQCEYVVNVSEHEAFGRTVVEAIMHGGTPLVLEGTGPAEIVRDTGVGFVFKNVTDLVEFASTHRADAISEDRRISALARYRPDHVARQYFHFLHQIHDSRGGDRGRSE